MQSSVAGSDSNADFLINRQFRLDLQLVVEINKYYTVGRTVNGAESQMCGCRENLNIKR